ncbi:MAG: hypothetical protein Q9166_006597 [cf. Caloplaca sp. 2 TL-2023]
MECFSKFRTDLFNAATKEVNAFEYALKEELSRRDKEKGLNNKSLRDEIDVLRRQVSRISELEQELEQSRVVNTKLLEKASLDELISAAKTPHEKVNQPTQDLSQSSYDHEHAKPEEAEVWHLKYYKCADELAKVKEARDILAVQVRRWKLTCRRLQLRVLGQRLQSPRPDHDDDLPRPGSALAMQPNRSPQFSGSADRVSTPNDAPGEQTPTLPLLAHAPMTIATASKDEDDVETADESEQRPLAGSQSKPRGSSRDRQRNPSQSRIKNPDSDGVVYDRIVALPRKRNRSPMNAPRRPKVIKEEILSSSPVAPRAFHTIRGLQESIDLDEINGTIYTPRKDQRRRQQMYGTRSLSPTIQRGLDARPTNRSPVQTHGERSENHDHDLALLDDEKGVEDDIPEVRNDAYYQRLGEEHAARLRDADRWKKVEKRRSKERLHNARQLAKHKDMKQKETRALQHHSVDAQKGLDRANVLQPTDANIILRRTVDIPSNKKRKTDLRNSDHGARYVQYLAEDGERSMNMENELLDSGQQDDAVITGASAEGLASSNIPESETRKRRLDQLLERPSPDKPCLSTMNKDARFSDVPSAFKAHTAFPKQPRAPKTPYLGQSLRAKAKNSAHSPSSAVTPFAQPNAPNYYRSPFGRPSSDKTTKSREPLLRSRPLSHLSLDDFKINPKRNQGYDYAFKEVVRKADQRKCLPGCTRLDCCGAIFRKLAETMDNNFYHTSRLMGPSQEDDEKTMLEDYLGDQAYRLRGMSKEEKAETLLQAKTKIMADHYGRHREVYAREPSPVGYWDVDMPNSQEAAELGRLAEIRTRQKVEERYREAMKSDGIWQFRDE